MDLHTHIEREREWERERERERERESERERERVRERECERERERERSFTTNYFNSFSKLIWEEEPLINNWYNVPASQMSIFTLFVSDWVLNWGAFFLWVFLSYVWIGTLWDQSITVFTSEHFCQKQGISCHWLNLAWPGVYIALRTQSACSAVPTKNIYHLTDRQRFLKCFKNHFSNKIPQCSAKTGILDFI